MTIIRELWDSETVLFMQSFTLYSEIVHVLKLYLDSRKRRDPIWNCSQLQKIYIQPNREPSPFLTPVKMMIDDDDDYYECTIMYIIIYYINI